MQNLLPYSLIISSPHKKLQVNVAGVEIELPVKYATEQLAEPPNMVKRRSLPGSRRQLLYARADFSVHRQRQFIGKKTLFFYGFTCGIEMTFLADEAMKSTQNDVSRVSARDWKET
jgi:hypothetical protein